MTDPKRWLDEGPLGEEHVGRLLRAGESLGPAKDAVDRGWAEFASLSGLVPPGGSGGGASGGPSGVDGGLAAATGAKVGFSTLALVKSFGIGAAIGVGASVGVQVLDTATDHGRAAERQLVSATSSVAFERAAELRTPLASPAPAPPLPPASAPRPSSSVVPPSVTSPPTAASVEPTVASLLSPSSVGTFAIDAPRAPNQLQLEASEVARVKSLLSGDRPSEALELLGATAARFPGGPLAQEREALTIEALARSGAPAAARQRAQAFVARYPRSPLVPRVKALVGP